MKDLISVCITTKNEENYIGPCLKSILNQTYENWEIILADSNSNDKTVEIAEKYVDKIKIIVKNSTMPQGRNLAAKHAKGNIMCFLDADIILLRNWFDTLLPHLYSPENVATYGDLYPIEESFRAKFFYSYQQIANPFLQLIRKPSYTKTGTAVLVKRNVFEKVGGLREDIILGEDFDFALRLSRYGRLKYVKGAKGYVSMRRFEKGYLRIMYIWAKSLPIIFGKYPSLYYTKEFP